MRKKILLVLVGLIIGIGLFIYYESLNPVYILIAGLILFLIFYLTNKKLILFPIAIVIGFSLSIHKFNSYKLKDIKTSIAQLTIVEKRKQDQGYRYFVDVYGKGIDEKSVLFSDDDYQIGDMFLANINANLPNRNTNPNLFNYRNYLISKDIASVIEIASIEKEARSSSILLNLRNGFYNYIHNIFEENLSIDSANFVISVVLGENLIDNDDIKDLGLAHILAVSGLHIDMLVGFILLIFAKLNLNYKHGYIFALITCLLYGYVIGFPYSVIRVLIINFISFLAFLYQKPEDRIKSLLIAAILILLFNPFAVLNSGFVLSFVASSGVYLVWPKIQRFMRDDYVSQSVGFTTSIQLILLPFSIYYYGLINLVSIFANFLIVPIFTIAMYFVFTLIFLYPFFRVLLIPVFKILDYLIYSIENLTSLLGKTKLLTFEFAKPSIILTVYFFILILVIFYIKKSNKDLLRRFYLTSFIVVLISLTYEFMNPEVSFSMIDIGQGDAFLLNDGGDYYLIDVGGPKYDNYDSGERILLPYLKSLGIRDIKGIFISHEDMDHSGNLSLVDSEFNVDNVITSIYNAHGLKGFNPIILKENESIELKNGKITCIFEGDSVDENSGSMGLLIEINGIKILTLGDLGKEFEDRLDIRADILKVSHHGSRNSTSRDFVEKVNPKVALISAGRNNRYGHPTKEVIENLDGIKIYNTQDSGMVKIDFSKDIKIESFIKGGYFR